MLFLKLNNVTFTISLYYNSDKLYAINTFTNSLDSVHIPHKMLDQLKDYINSKDGICINGYFYDTSEMSLRDFILLCKKGII